MGKRYKLPYPLDDYVRESIILKAKQNVMRTRPEYDLDDLIQEGMLVYARCADRYRDANSPRHFAKLVLNSFENHITNLAWRRTRRQWLVFSDDIETVAPAIDDLSVALSQLKLPPHLVRYVNLLAKGKGRRAVPWHKSRFKETSRQRMCRLVGVDDTRNLDAELREALKNV